MSHGVPADLPIQPDDPMSDAGPSAGLGVGADAREAPEPEVSSAPAVASATVSGELGLVAAPGGEDASASAGELACVAAPSGKDASASAGELALVVAPGAGGLPPPSAADDDNWENPADAIYFKDSYAPPRGKGRNPRSGDTKTVAEWLAIPANACHKITLATLADAPGKKCPYHCGICGFHYEAKRLGTPSTRLYTFIDCAHTHSVF